MYSSGHQLVAVRPWEDPSRSSEALLSAHLSGDVYSALGEAFELFLSVFLFFSTPVSMCNLLCPLWRVSVTGEDLLTLFQQ